MVHNLTGGGAERVATLWANGFAEMGETVKLVIRGSLKSDYPVSEDVDIISLGPTINNRLVRLLMLRVGLERNLYLHSLQKFLQKEKPDVFIGVMGSYARDAFEISRDLETTIIQTYHSSFDLPLTAPQNRRKDIEKCYIKDKSVLYRTVLTEADKKHIGHKMQNVFVMPNPLAFEPLQTVPVKKKYILACGRLDVWEVKGFDLLIKAWGKIAEYHPDWKLRIAGSGSKQSSDFLENLAISNNVQNSVELLGFRDDVISLYKESEVFVLSSRYEGFGMVLIEAMSQGCACVACDYKGRQAEIITSEDQGLLCKSDDVKALSDSLDKMLTDESYRKTCQINAIEQSKNFSINKTIERWYSVFDSIGIK